MGGAYFAGWQNLATLLFGDFALTTSKFRDRPPNPRGGGQFGREVHRKNDVCPRAVSSDAGGSER